MRRIVVAANWKMNKDAVSGAELVRTFLERYRERAPDTKVEVILCPPFTLLGFAAQLLEGSAIKLGAQNLHFEKEGAFTGEISGVMLASAGCTHVIVGHSERRQYFGESDEIINRKALAALNAGLSPIICVGESLEQRESGVTHSVVEEQINGVLKGFDERQFAAAIIAYEPVWAIGTGRNATPEQAQDVHIFIRKLLRRSFGDSAANRMPLLYGGSMKSDNALALLTQPDVDGGLVGGASLDAGQFGAIVEAATRSAIEKQIV